MAFAGERESREQPEKGSASNSVLLGWRVWERWWWKHEAMLGAVVWWDLGPRARGLKEASGKKSEVRKPSSKAAQGHHWLGGFRSVPFLGSTVSRERLGVRGPSPAVNVRLHRT